MQGVELIDPDGRYGTLSADAYVVAMGSFSPAMLRPLGIPCNVYPAKGYSSTFPIVRPDAAPVVSLTDSSHKIVFSRLGDRLRMAGTAELSGYSRGLNTARCEALTRLARDFPDALDFERVGVGLRPSTPSNVPIIGRSRIPNLYVNTGHGTLGWTMGVGSAGPWLTWSAGASLNRNFLSLVCEPMKKLQLAGVARAMFASRRAWVFGAAMAAAGVAHAAPWKSRSGIR